MVYAHYGPNWECRKNQFASGYKPENQAECYQCGGIFRGKRDFEICKEHGKKEKLGTNPLRTPQV